MRKRTIATLSASTALAVVAIAAPTASAEPNPPGCDRGAFCIYSGPDQTGSLLVESQGNWSGSVSGRSVFNNGTPFPGGDHIQLTWTYNGGTFSDCLHYNPGPGDYKWNFVPGVVFKQASWRGEC
ncbi:peptidase inhibitor family I36 protein [Streptomyces sp. NPDC014892]|uniref:peptidase inhibitor family I36 protein n=1 Tax=Streptomyces TaxID=1883 RepID=UPI001EFBFDC4|nr:peptidase inhibitor family I36 protein [Streptomyces deccanensis]ULR54005.1 peptidase inhibitor family I36 protein [Streptomyces deccanensis]